jgi:hypothetical protein
MCPPNISQRPRCATKEQWGQESEEGKGRTEGKTMGRETGGHGKGYINQVESKNE